MKDSLAFCIFVENVLCNMIRWIGAAKGMVLREGFARVFCIFSMKKL